MKTLVSNHFELAKLLLEVYGDRIKINPDLLLFGTIEGTLDSNLFIIHFVGDEYLNISTYSDTKEVLDEFLPLLKEVMANAEPICSYDVKSPSVNEEEFVSFIEWDLIDPMQTLRDIMTGEAFGNCAKIYNFNYYNSNKMLIKTSYRYNKIEKK